jgi:hypothetical protein
VPLFSTFASSSIRAVRAGVVLLPPNVPTSFSATGVSADDNNGGAIVTFTAPDTEGGLRPVTSYQVENQNTGVITTVTSGSTVPLAKNTTQTFRVRAVNSAGTSAWSSSDSALSFRQSYGPVEYGSQSVVNIPAGTVVGYSMLSGAGSSSTPDTRTYGNVYAVSEWYGWGGFSSGPYISGGAYTANPYGNAYWYGYDAWGSYIDGYLSYAGFYGLGSNEYYYGYAPNFNFGVIAYPSYGQTGGSPPQTPDYGSSTYIYHNNENTQAATTSLGYNLAQSSASGSFTIIGNYIRIYLGSRSYYGGRPVEYYGPGGSARIWYGT